ncbi:MAG: non-homologous end-joining DNA ligase [Dethiobacteria bacterium]|jgi:bifunctional non-homologous end joining protein LigD
MLTSLNVPASLNINGEKIAITNLDRELWPGEGITKYHLIKYYLEIAPYLLPHLKNRFLSFRRFPKGIGEPGFFQKNLPEGAPPWIKSMPIEHGQKITNYILCTGTETLAWLGNQSCLEIHPWLSAANRPDFPDFVIFDLDPMEGVPFSQVCNVALVFQELLQKKGLRSYPKTSGLSGIQVYFPIEPLYTYEDVRAFALQICEMVNRLLPEVTTLERTKAKRGKRIYLDYLQNARGKTIVAPYSPRPHPGAPVSAPLQWPELQSPTINPSLFNIKTILPRVQEKGDLFAPVLSDRQRIRDH